jgi:hypothetical protein
MLSVVRYESKLKSMWDDFILKSKNGVFIFHRDYVEYHSDRFIDHSLMFFDSGMLLALLPANLKDGVLHSHGGLTFGGFVTDARMDTCTMLEMFDLLKKYAREAGILKMIYKCVPHIYHSIPAEEDLYALFRNNARLVRRDISSTILLSNRPQFTKQRRWGVRRAKAEGVAVSESRDFAAFMKIEEENLTTRYGVRPVHTAEEIAMLAGRFPDSIRLFAAHARGTMIAGVIVYRSTLVAHVQYIAATEEGKRKYAIDLIIDHLLNEVYNDVRYFDFGISTEKAGTYLNEGLINQKEEFGARAIAYDFYEVQFDQP